MDLLEKLANAVSGDKLTKLARAFDTKGYPDDKNPDHWRTINHSHVHVDANGNVDGGAGQKFNGNAWNSQKHPHKPESYEGYQKPEPTPPPEPKPTKEDLLSAWKKVVKYQVAMKQGKSEATWNKHASNMKNAISEYEALKAKAGPDVQGSHNPKLDLAKQFSDLQYGQFVAGKNKGTSSIPPAMEEPPLETLAQITNPSASPSANISLNQYLQSTNQLKWALFDYQNADNDQKVSLAKNIKALLQDVSAENYDKFTLNDKKKIWAEFGSKGAYMKAVEMANEIVSQEVKTPVTTSSKPGIVDKSKLPTSMAALKKALEHDNYDPSKLSAEDFKTLSNANKAFLAYTKAAESAFKHPTTAKVQAAQTAQAQYFNAAEQCEEFGLDNWVESMHSSTLPGDGDVYDLTNALDAAKAISHGESLESLPISWQKNYNTFNSALQSSPLQSLANSTTKQGMEAFPNGLKSAGIGKKYKPVTMAEIKAAQQKSDTSKVTKQATYQKLGAESAKAWAKGTTLEKDAAYDYTSSYSKYNEPLRGQEYYGSYKGVGKVDFNNIYNNPDQKKKTEALTSLINKTSLGEPQMVYRGCHYKGMDKALNVPLSLLQSGDINKIRAALEGMEWTDHGFGSVGANNGTGFSGDIKMEIYAPKGTKGIYAEPFSAYGQDYGENWDGHIKPGHTPGHENEIILQRGTRYKIMGVEKNGSGIKLVMQIVSQDPYKIP